ncbi:unnamed protein product [Discosporangium mesarthrocarpum]
MPTLVNELGKRLLGKNGPMVQDRVEKLTLGLGSVRKRLSPVGLQNAVLMCAVLTLHMLVQIWLYLIDRFNMYFVLLCVAAFTFKLYQKWGFNLILGAKEALRTRRYRLSLSSTTPEAKRLPISNVGPSNMSTSTRLASSLELMQRVQRAGEGAVTGA